jgi:D-alanine-D-alanine ligase
LLGLPYTGSGVMASSLAIDKAMTKRLWQCDGLRTPGYVVLRHGRYTPADVEHVLATLGLPLIVKPAREGSSIGLSKVTARQQLPAALEQAAQLDADILCEQFIDGPELTCPVLGTGAQARALPLIRIVAPEGNYDYQNKYFTDAVQYLVPCGLPEDEQQAIAQMVLDAYRSLGCRGWARADVMVDAATGLPYLLEMNTSPGMTGHSLVPMSARAAGLSYEELCLSVLASASLDGGGRRP